MLELELSTIPDSEQDALTLTSLLQEFQQKTGIRVRQRPMSWSTAWPEMLTFASHGKGVDVSHIGGSWVSSLTMMNCLRPFKPAEVNAAGGGQTFMAPVWESTRQMGDPRVWAMPWTAYIYVICYRQDVFARLGIDPKTVFESYETIHAAFEKLRLSDAVEIPWLNPRIPAPYTDLVHEAASWIWNAGGDFMDEAGRRVTFDSPQAIAGLCTWLETYQAVPEAYRPFGSVETVDLFRQGRVGAVLTDIRVANDFISRGADLAVRETLGILPIGNTPWAGGGSFVIWQQVVGYPEREQAAVELVKFLTGQEASLRWAREVGSMPARLDVLGEVYPPDNPLYATVQQSAGFGRTYRALPLWRRIEYQLAQELNACLEEAGARPVENPAVLLRAHLEPLAWRLNLTLGN
jgi:ABC-type glycerol-3-phosphate transport system substrate-binding protein